MRPPPSNHQTTALPPSIPSGNSNQTLAAPPTSHSECLVELKQCLKSIATSVDRIRLILGWLQEQPPTTGTDDPAFPPPSSAGDVLPWRTTEDVLGMFVDEPAILAELDMKTFLLSVLNENFREDDTGTGDGLDSFAANFATMADRLSVPPPNVPLTTTVESTGPSVSASATVPLNVRPRLNVPPPALNLPPPTTSSTAPPILMQNPASTALPAGIPKGRQSRWDSAVPIGTSESDKSSSSATNGLEEQNVLRTERKAVSATEDVPGGKKPRLNSALEQASMVMADLRSKLHTAPGNKSDIVGNGGPDNMYPRPRHDIGGLGGKQISAMGAQPDSVVPGPRIAAVLTPSLLAAPAQRPVVPVSSVGHTPLLSRVEAEGSAGEKLPSTPPATSSYSNKEVIMAASKAFGWPYTDKHYGSGILCFDAANTKCPLSPAYVPEEDQGGLRIDDRVFMGGLWAYYTYRKVLHFGANPNKLAPMCQTEAEPSRLRHIAKRIKSYADPAAMTAVYPEWRNSVRFAAIRTALEAIYKGPDCRSDLREALSRTKHHLLVYTGDPSLHDAVFSVGCSESEFHQRVLASGKDAAETCRWIAREQSVLGTAGGSEDAPELLGQNLLGFMLMTIREEILSAAESVAVDAVIASVLSAKVVHASLRPGAVNPKLSESLQRVHYLTPQSPLSCFYVDQFHDFTIGDNQYRSVHHFVESSLFEYIGLREVSTAVRKAGSVVALSQVLQGVFAAAGKTWSLPGVANCVVPANIVGLMANWRAEKGVALVEQATRAKLKQLLYLNDELASTSGALVIETLEMEASLSIGMGVRRVTQLIKDYLLNPAALFCAVNRQQPSHLGLTLVGANLSGVTLTKMRLAAVENTRIQLWGDKSSTKLARPRYTTSLKTCPRLRYILNGSSNYFCVNAASVLSCAHESDEFNFVVNGAKYRSVYQYYYAELFYNIGHSDRTIAIQRATAVTEIRRVIGEALIEDEEKRQNSSLTATDAGLTKSAKNGEGGDAAENPLEDLMIEWKERCGPPSLRQAFRAVCEQSAEFRHQLLASQQWLLVDAGLLDDDELCVGMSDTDFRRYIVASGMDVDEFAEITFYGGRPAGLSRRQQQDVSLSAGLSLKRCHLGANLSGLILTELRAELRFGDRLNRMDFSRVVDMARQPVKAEVVLASSAVDS